MTYIWETKDRFMKKIKKYNQDEEKPGMVEEPMAIYDLKKNIPSLKDFTFNDFKKIADKVDFTQKEWSDILHISERTLQRYAHDNGFFNTGVIDRILQINKVLERGKKFLETMKDLIPGFVEIHTCLKDNYHYIRLQVLMASTTYLLK